MAADQVTLNIQNMERGSGAGTIVSSATPSIDSDAYGSYKITAQAAAITGVTVVGTPSDLQRLVVRVLDNGSPRAITWGAQFEAVGAALPTTTVAGKRHTVVFLYDATSAKWGAISAVVEA